MNKARWIKRLRKFHKWPGIIISAFVILFALSGIIMNHRGTVSSIDVSRKILPSNYEYSNWNQAAIKGSLNINGDSALMYGNIGIWKTNDKYKTFIDFNQGFPNGIDNRKINALIKFQETSIVAGTHFGLYKRGNSENLWIELEIPVKNKRITDLTIKDDTLIILTRHYLLKSTDLLNFQKIQLPEPVNYQRKAGLFNTFWELHSGKLFGLIGKLIVDIFGIVVILLSVTGLLHFFFPKIIRRRKRKEKLVASLVSTKRKNLRWHNVVGYVFVLFLVINTFSGMHLRPPLLIAIANKQVGIIPFTNLDTPNPWHDKLRRVDWNENLKKYIFSTSDGFYFSDESLLNTLQPFPVQPPVSVMGCNVLKTDSNGNYIVGSFSGMYIWNFEKAIIDEYFTKVPYQKPEGMEMPISNTMVAGYIEKNGGEEVWFDFNRGVLSMTPFDRASFPEMPEEIIKESPMSLWNFALEVHTGRIFEKFIGSFYILYVPLAGICILLVLISGFFIWWLGYKKKRKE
ncbi:MAG: PepSY domain-containing protein [Mariniphaga sp.]|nr:PepSY domain-containing protein [Mariniphaga sp.]